MIFPLDLWFWNFESPYFIQEEYRRVHFKTHCCITDAIVIIMIAYDLIDSVYQDSTINFKLKLNCITITLVTICAQTGLARFLKPIVKSHLGWQHGHLCAPHFSFNTPKIAAISAWRSPGDTVTLESLKSRYDVEWCISSKYNSLKINHFSHVPKSDVIDETMVIRAVVCGLICYCD